MTGGTYWVPKHQAENLAMALAYRVGALALLDGRNPEPGRIVTRTIVGPYPGIPDAWGLTERWRYADRDDLGEFGGGFLPIDVARRLAAKAPRCGICRRLLKTGAVAAMDCGGDCLRCMAEAGDPDAIVALGKEAAP